MMYNEVMIGILRWFFHRLRHTRMMTNNMRSPGSGILGIIARSVMHRGKELVSKDAVERL